MAAAVATLAAALEGLPAAGAVEAVATAMGDVLTCAAAGGRPRATEVGPGFPHAALVASLEAVVPESTDDDAVCQVVALVAAAPAELPPVYASLAAALLGLAGDEVPLRRMGLALELVEARLPVLPSQTAPWGALLWRTLARDDLGLAARANAALVRLAAAGSATVFAPEALAWVQGASFTRDGELVALRVWEALVAIAGAEPTAAPVAAVAEHKLLAPLLETLADPSVDVLIQLNMLELVVAAVQTRAGRELLTGSTLEALASVALASETLRPIRASLLHIVAPQVAHVAPHLDLVALMAALSSDDASLGFGSLGLALSTPEGFDAVMGHADGPGLVALAAETALAEPGSPLHAPADTVAALHSLGGALSSLPDEASARLLAIVTAAESAGGAALLSRRELPFPEQRVAVYGFLAGAARSGAGIEWLAALPGFMSLVSNIASDVDKASLEAKHRMVCAMTGHPASALAAAFGDNSGARIAQLAESGILTPESGVGGSPAAMLPPVTIA
ncbi:uncharacterized protein AMSG_00438 [Thecamonas trahens ATCC 50062]|uniref:26S proteasome non-ATPase regulatory subunit 5 n=1 Tax=Thecamonas trahens ATCC 50062 TaxID=461836 RepID=A0A0L0D8V9_THETB|nr:hypothetical protein AMSG_00438 [Thecamonas trahens ATCC 50062]KNC48660.1 hypothetical protein AMSG_00438 [Thecamonas trahens ATCC 50062]|eukprot:XP_013762716.1 hypothetical protein AMSG_00438 [Thecamonas trahens ATCC 50062]